MTIVPEHPFTHSIEAAQLYEQCNVFKAELKRLITVQARRRKQLRSANNAINIYVKSKKFKHYPSVAVLENDKDTPFEIKIAIQYRSVYTKMLHVIKKSINQATCTLKMLSAKYSVEYNRLSGLH